MILLKGISLTSEVAALQPPMAAELRPPPRELGPANTIQVPSRHLLDVGLRYCNDSGKMSCLADGLLQDPSV